PPETALVGAGAPPGLARLEMLRPLPAVLLSEDRAEVLHTMMQGAGPARPAPFVGVVWIAKEVVVAVRLSRQFGHVAMVAMDRSETPGPIRIKVELAVSRRDQLR